MERVLSENHGLSDRAAVVSPGKSGTRQEDSTGSFAGKGMKLTGKNHNEPETNRSHSHDDMKTNPEKFSTFTRLGHDAFSQNVRTYSQGEGIAVAALLQSASQSHSGSGSGSGSAPRADSGIWGSLLASGGDIPLPEDDIGQMPDHAPFGGKKFGLGSCRGEASHNKPVNDGTDKGLRSDTYRGESQGSYEGQKLPSFSLSKDDIFWLGRQDSELDCGRSSIPQSATIGQFSFSGSMNESREGWRRTGRDDGDKRRGERGWSGLNPSVNRLPSFDPNGSVDESLAVAPLGATKRSCTSADAPFHESASDRPSEATIGPPGGGWTFRKAEPTSNCTPYAHGGDAGPVAPNGVTGGAPAAFLWNQHVPATSMPKKDVPQHPPQECFGALKMMIPCLRNFVGATSTAEGLEKARASSSTTADVTRLSPPTSMAVHVSSPPALLGASEAYAASVKNLPSHVTSIIAGDGSRSEVYRMGILSEEDQKRMYRQRALERYRYKRKRRPMVIEARKNQNDDNKSRDRPRERGKFKKANPDFVPITQCRAIGSDSDETS